MSNFGEKLKTLRENKNLTQKKLANSLNIGQTTIANYEKNIRFPNLEILISIADFFEVSIDFLVGRQNKYNNYFNDTIYSIEELKDIYFDNIIEGNIKNAYNSLLYLVEKNYSLKQIYCNIIEPSLIKIGHLWETGKLSVGYEHYFSEVTKDIMSQLKLKYQISHINIYNSIFICPNGEQHTLGLKMIHDILEQEGWNTYFLGSNIPIDSILNIIKEKEIEFVFISTTMDYNINSTKTLISSLKNSNIKRNIKYIVGGKAFNKNNNLSEYVDADIFISGCDILISKINKLIYK